MQNMMIIAMFIKEITKSIGKLLLIISLFINSCSGINDDKEKLVIQTEDDYKCISKDTVYLCDTTKIGKLVWMAEDLQVETFRNGDSIKKVTSYEEWKEAEDTYTPALYIVEIDKKRIPEFNNALH